MLVFWLIPQAFVGTKFLRYSLSLIPLIYMTASVGIIEMWDALSVSTKRFARDSRVLSAAALTVASMFIIAPAVVTVDCLRRSHPSLYVNVFGRNRAGYFFPHDEFYDLGARESIRFIAEAAPYGSKMASEIPGVVQYYLERFNRPDIRSEIISQPSFSLTVDRPDFVMLQHGRVYIENIANFKFIEATFPVSQASVYGGAVASRVYATSGLRVSAGSDEQKAPRTSE
jgi:hypothetical protein